MEPPPLLSLPIINPAAAAIPTTTTTVPMAAAATIAAATGIHLNYSDSIESSPRSRATDVNDDTLPPVPGAKLRLMCSYGGHIIPRPHDKTLCYMGGDTKLVVVDRKSSLSSLCTRLSNTLVDGRHFTLKYQLPNEDLDSLVSISTDEDLENMIEEYDRISAATSSSSVTSRIRLFLFFNKPETAATMGFLIDDAKSETWFVDALNGSGLLPRGLSDSVVDNCLVNLDGDSEQQKERSEGENKRVKGNLAPEVQYSLPDSPVVENASSFSSSCSSPSMANLPPIRVRIEDGGMKFQDQRAGMEEQFAQMTFAANNLYRQEDAASALPPQPVLVAETGAVTSAPRLYPIGGSSDNFNRVMSDDERSDQGAPTGFPKPPLPLQQVQQKAGATYNLPSPDSVASDSSIASANSLSKHVHYQDQVHVVSRENRVAAGPNSNMDHSGLGSQVLFQQHAQDSRYAMAQQLDPQQQQHQQYIHHTTQYIPRPATPAPVPISSYYPVYAPPSQQQLQHPADQQYPVYVMPVVQPQQPFMSVQSTVVDPGTVASTRPPTPPTTASAVVAASAAYKDACAPAKHEMVASAYGTAMTSNAKMLQIPPNQFQQQYLNFPQMHHPSQPLAAAAAPATANYGYEYAKPPHDQVYYTQHQAAPLPPQYQTMTQAAAAAALADASKQLPGENIMQQIRPSQPL